VYVEEPYEMPLAVQTTDVLHEYIWITVCVSRVSAAITQPAGSGKYVFWHKPLPETATSAIVE
jgi:hypothetical protein